MRYRKRLPEKTREIAFFVTHKKPFLLHRVHAGFQSVTSLFGTNNIPAGKGIILKKGNLWRCKLKMVNF
ncbi:MAG: hypothetical protein CVV30_00285 [Methanomicrobiales archaeon HGW-Methanomicrobiales-1]|nr:MAG: hypothetical protein CVV30_00285 [Methanomicrobiales archaeon HGW-Methanomicrobiales-1]